MLENMNKILVCQKLEKTHKCVYTNCAIIQDTNLLHAVYWNRMATSFTINLNR